MAKRMAWTDPNTGTVYPDSTWLPLGVYIDFSGPTVRAEFLGFATEDIARKVLMSVLGVPGGKKYSPIGSKAYTLDAAASRAMAGGKPATTSMIDAVSSPCYAVAETTLDVPAPTDAEPDRKVSFFSGATDVTLV